ncbi:MAG: phosphotransferase [Acidimicrobiales bacterium]
MALVATVGQDEQVVPVPRRWSDISPTWMTASLARRLPGVVVSDVKVGAVVDGTNSRARVELSYGTGSGPRSVFVKARGRPIHRLALVALGAWAAEARLAESSVTLPLEHPVPYAAGIDRLRFSAVVIMEDVTNSGGRPNVGTGTLSVEEARSGLDGLARLHALYWDRPLPETLGFLRPWRLGAYWAPISAASLLRGLRRLEGADRRWLMPPSLRARDLERQFRMSAALAALGPQTVLHGDPHPGNTYGLAGGRTGFYDWQLVRRGNWSHDVGYFLVGSLAVEERRVHEKDLLAFYLDSLRRAGAGAGVEAPSDEAAWARYRASPAFGLGTWLHTLSVGTLQPLDICLATLERFATAYGDLETHRSVVAVR